MTDTPRPQRTSEEKRQRMCGAQHPEENKWRCNALIGHRGDHEFSGPNTREHAGIVYARWPKND